MPNNEIEMSSLISVIVPIYKVEDYLRKCVDSILNQTYKNLEIVLVDDGSPDHCGEICDEYAQMDSRITVIHKQNGGLSDARNAGIDVAHGEYIMFVDSDDYIANNMLEKLFFAIQTQDADMSLCNFLKVDDNGNTLNKKKSTVSIKNVVLTGLEAVQRLILNDGYHYTIAWCKLYKAELFQEVRFPKGKYNEDEFVSHVLYAKCSRVACVEEALYYYVQRKDSIMGSARMAVSIKSFDAPEGLLNRALFIQPLGMFRDASRYYFDVVLRVSHLLTHYQVKTEKERTRMKEMHSMIRKNHHLCKYCTAKEKIHIALFFISPSLHQTIIKLLGK